MPVGACCLRAGDANGTYKFMPRPGTTLADALSAIHDLNATHFTQFYTYGFDWVPNKYIRWYINNKLIFGERAKHRYTRTSHAPDRSYARLTSSQLTVLPGLASFLCTGCTAGGIVSAAYEDVMRCRMVTISVVCSQR